MELIVVLKPDYSAQFLGQGVGGSSEIEELKQALDAEGVKLDPLHPGVNDPTLSVFFIARGPSVESRPQAVAERMLRCKAVDAAYLKPRADLP